MLFIRLNWEAIIAVILFNHHRENSQNVLMSTFSSPATTTIPRHANEEFLGTIEEHKTMDEIENERQVNPNLPQNVQNVLEDEMDQIKDTVRKEFRQLRNDLIEKLQTLRTFSYSVLCVLVFIWFFSSGKRRQQLVNLLGPFGWLFKMLFQKNTQKKAQMNTIL
ncbi:hypothetical protein RFI_12914 [Reticulomyxa filosa]|uniref:Uncharacterized protein n=1 Tax=Reticulomyxa filosa TaxID=46433 RepID=X6NFX8_RETFI|nr:hypothetical protein RFI_12914 [Reticulomyxa filosa]|eukprot:ETO24247.1 hypothetical protein RFI_12914 [Reticulomyxa filosa]